MSFGIGFGDSELRRLFWFEILDSEESGLGIVDGGLSVIFCFYNGGVGFGVRV